MKNITQRFLFVLCCAVLIFAGNTVAVKAQTAVQDGAPLKNILAKLVRDKKSTGAFVLITPDDLAKLSPQERQAIVDGDPCETVTQISFNQTVNGQLTSSDCRLDDNSYADFYAFNGNSGQNITLLMSSSAVDTYLGLANISGTFVMEDDNGGGGTNSRINTTLPETGLYIVLANTALPNQFGNYTLSLTGAVTCSYSVNPTSATIAPEGGTFSFTINAPAGCQWGAGIYSGEQFLTLNTTNGSGTSTISYTATPNGYSQPRTGHIIVAGQRFDITQPPMNCTYSINPSSVTVPATASTGTFTLTTQPGCVWLASYNYNSFLWTNTDVHTGSAEILFTTTTNNGADRTGTITIAGQTFTVFQPGLNCTFSASPLNMVFDRFENRGTFTVNTQPGCSWSLTRGAFWIELDPYTGVGTQTVGFKIYANQYSQPRSSVIAIYANDIMRINITQNGDSVRTPFDFDGDAKADVSVFRPSNGAWYVQQSYYGLSGTSLGTATDKIVPADYDGDGKTDYAVYRSGAWYLQRSQAGFAGIAFGDGNDIPVPADFDGDGKAEIAVFRPSNGYWYALNLATNQFTATLFGISTDRPAPADYDGDGKTDLAVNRDGIWYIQRSQLGFIGIQFGDGNDKTVPADYDGDRKADIAVFRPSNGTWYLLQSQLGFTGIAFGLGTDIPAAADYDGDGKTDIAVVRNGNWFLNRTAQGFSSVLYGTSTDLPVPNAFVR